MPAYFIADITIDNPDTYQKYLASFMEIFERYDGKLRVVSSSPIEVIEGAWVPNGIVLMEFPSLDAAHQWTNDPDYKALAQIRHASARTNMILIEGLAT